MKLNCAVKNLVEKCRCIMKMCCQRCLIYSLTTTTIILITFYTGLFFLLLLTLHKPRRWVRGSRKGLAQEGVSQRVYWVSNAFLMSCVVSGVDRVSGGRVYFDWGDIERTDRDGAEINSRGGTEGTVNSFMNSGPLGEEATRALRYRERADRG